LRALVLEPELDLERLQPELPAQLLALLVVRVRAFLEEAGHQYNQFPREKMSTFMSDDWRINVPGEIWNEKV